MSPAKHNFRKCDRKVLQTDRQTDGQTDGQTTDKVIPMCRYASQATQKQSKSVANRLPAFKWEHLGSLSRTGTSLLFCP